MKIDFTAVRKALKAFDFKTLFYEHLGWDKHQANIDIPVNGSTVSLTAIAQKRGFVAFVCGSIPDRPTRLKIDHQVTKSVREHFVIYTDEPSGQQVWHWVRREPGKPLASRDHRFDISQSGDSLIQRLENIAVSIEEEESLTLPDMTGRGREAFDVDKVTKKFYDRFKTEHAAFLKHITGFPPPVKVDGKLEPHPDLQWYTSLMLNRLMFVYFIQKKGFLDGDTDYLRHRLAMVQQARGKDKFQSFYRYFLMRLFQDGLGMSPGDRKLDPAMEKLLGKVPYLNGGFFEVHKLETDYPDADIPDQAFERLFDFFEYADKANGVRWNWHLDERTCRADNEINPDVVGYIFEKYVNQKQMGAYYTKEDITEYISKSTIIPLLFDAARKKCAIAFKPDGALWQLLRDDPDRYIYPAVGHGVTWDYDRVNHREHKRRAEPLPLPADIEAGITDVSKRDGWNMTALPEYGLPSETWREVVARRQRCLAIREKLLAGEVHEINDLVTHNLDIWQFARDAIVNAEGPELLRALWHTLAGRIPEKSNETMSPGMSILDPTCGSGAFLFAALVILETLYGDCLDRMERFIEDADRAIPLSSESQIRKLIAGGESALVEFKSSARWDVKENRHNPILEEVIVKTVAGFMNGDGGTLLIGVSDNGTLLGLARDYKHTNKINPSSDQFELWLTKRLMNDLGNGVKPHFHVDFARIDSEEICRVRVYRTAKPVFVEKNKQEVLYVREGNATNSYTKSSEILAYKERHWPAGEQVPPPPSPCEIEKVPLAGSTPLKRAFTDFRQTLALIEKHPNERYFILKSIIINNLFGVDIMEEAVEICKLRLFLKLVAQVEAADQLEPLPDVDFNIRAGNTLVGFSTRLELQQMGEDDLIRRNEITAILEEAEDADSLYKRFQQIQTRGTESPGAFKAKLQKKFSYLRDKCDAFLADTYTMEQSSKDEALRTWKEKNKPFHWFVEFYGIMSTGGFDVIIGNPPYLEFKEVDYTIKGFETVDTNAVHAVCIERGARLLHSAGCMSMIVPLALVSTQRMRTVQNLLEEKGAVWYANFAWRPGKLFDTVNRALTVFTVSRPSARRTFTTGYQKWTSETRNTLMPLVSYIPVAIKRSVFWVPKLTEELEIRVLGKVFEGTVPLARYMTRIGQKVFYRTTGGLYWKVFTDFAPAFRANGKKGHSSRETWFNVTDGLPTKSAVALLSSNLFWWWYTIASNLRDLNPSDIQCFPVPDTCIADADLERLGEKYVEDMVRNSTMRVRQQKQTGKTETQSFKIQLSKPIIDEIDRVLAKHYAFTDEELDFIINYDIKYRMGGADDGEDG